MSDYALLVFFIAFFSFFFFFFFFFFFQAEDGIREPLWSRGLGDVYEGQMLNGARSTRHGASEDIAGAVAFLLSDDGEWVNGQSWRVNGGVSYAN